MDPHQVPQSSHILPHIVQLYNPPLQDHNNPHIIHIPHPSNTNGSIMTYQSMDIPTTHVTGTQNIHHIQPMPMDPLSLTAHSNMASHHNMTHQIIQPVSPQIHSQSDMSVMPQMLVNPAPNPYYGQYDDYYRPKDVQKLDESPAGAKLEPEVMIVVDNIQIECKPEPGKPKEEIQENVRQKGRIRNTVSDPKNWECNVRKLKHQRGEAYINRRGKYVPEKKVKTTKDCLTSCKFKCATMITDADRETIFKAFYSLTANEKKHFLLNSTERAEIKHANKYQQTARKYSFKYFFLVKEVKHTVCKRFYLGTLAISQKPVYNVHLGKSELNIPKPDGRGLSEASAHALPEEVKDRARKHIMSLKTTNGKSVKQYSKKRQFVTGFQSITQIYHKYENLCKKENVNAVKLSMYRSIMKREYNLHFKKTKEESRQLCWKCKGPLKKKKDKK